MRIEKDTIILRTMIEADIADVIYWNTEATEWMNWDAPWEHEDDTYDWDEYAKRKRAEILKISEDELQHRLEVCIKDEKETHIGVVSCYFINDEYHIDEHGTRLAIGMDLYEPKYRGKGYGSLAYSMYIAYIKSFGYDTIYTQTWSGNIPLIKMAEKLGFQECNRYVGLRHVAGKAYNGLTFVLPV